MTWLCIRRLSGWWWRCAFQHLRGADSCVATSGRFPAGNKKGIGTSQDVNTRCFKTKTLRPFLAVVVATIKKHIFLLKAGTFPAAATATKHGAFNKTSGRFPASFEQQKLIIIMKSWKSRSMSSRVVAKQNMKCFQRDLGTMGWLKVKASRVSVVTKQGTFNKTSGRFPATSEQQELVFSMKSWSNNTQWFQRDLGTTGWWKVKTSRCVSVASKPGAFKKKLNLKKHKISTYL